MARVDMLRIGQKPLKTGLQALFPRGWLSNPSGMVLMAVSIVEAMFQAIKRVI